MNDPKIVPPPRETIDTSMESLIHWFKIYTEGFRPPVGEAYVARGVAEGRARVLFCERRHEPPVSDAHTRAQFYEPAGAGERWRSGA